MAADSDFMRHLEEGMETGNIPNKLWNGTYNNYLENYSLDVLKFITKQLNGNKTPEVCKCSEIVLQKMSKVVHPEEFMLALLEEIEDALNDDTLLILLNSMKIVMPRLQTKHSMSLSWSFQSLYSYFEKSIASEDFDADYICLRFKNFWPIAELFLTEVIPKLSLTKNETSICDKNYSIFIINLIGLYGSHISILQNKNFNPTIIANQLTKALISFCKDPFELFNDFNSTGQEQLEINNVGIGTVMYFIIAENIQNNHILQVYSPMYIIINCLQLIIVLCSSKSYITMEKGLLLLDSCLNRISNNIKFNSTTLDAFDHMLFVKSMENIIVYHPDKKVRSQCFLLFNTYIERYDTDSVYFLFYHLSSTINHSGLFGSILFKSKCLIDKDCVKLKRLFRILEKMLFISKSKNIDVLQDYDKVITVLNLMRFIILRITGYERNLFKSSFMYWSNYLCCLKNDICCSKELCYLKLKDLEKIELPDIKLTVNLENLDMSKEEQLKTVNMSLTVLDLVDNLSNRVTELLEH